MATDMAGRPARDRLYGFVWRWHFYAGLIVAPFLLVLAVTGAIYLFNDELNDLIYPAQRFVAPHAASVGPTRLVRAALAAHPGGASRIDLPATADRAAVVFVTPREGRPLRIAVDPGTGDVLGAVDYDRTLVGSADRMHGTLTIGTVGDRIVELAACWTLFLLGSGLYLWWPRGRRGLGGILYPRLGGRGRLLWRDLHAVTGVWTALLIGFLIVTGLPWAGIEGGLLQTVGRMTGTGYPPGHATHDPPSSTTMKQAIGSAPWTLETMPMPASHGGTGHGAAHHGGGGGGGGGGDAAAIAGLDAIARSLARDHGLRGGYRLFLPTGTTGVYTAYTDPDQPQGQRTLHFDRWSGALIREVDYADYGSVARAIELGVQIHMGNYWGRANQVVMLATCLAAIMLAVSGPVMWWRRRPTGTLGAPRAGAAARAAPLALALGAAGLLLPMFGASLLVILVVDTGWRAITREERAAR